MSVDFETALKKVETLADETSSNMGTLKQSILDLAPTVGIGPTQLADALLVVESTGFKGAEAMAILEQAAKASAIGMGETSDIARAITGAINSYGAENLSAAQAADILTQAVVEGGAEAKDFAANIGTVVPIAAQLGVSFQEAAAFIATYTKLGVNADEATTGLKGVLTTILSPAAEARKALAAIGMTADQLRQQVASAGLGETLIGLLSKLKETGGADAVAAVFGNVRALSAELGTAGSQAEVYREVIERIGASAGTLDERFQNWRTTTAATWKEFTTQVQVASIELGDRLAPAFSNVLKGAQPLIDVLIQVVDWFGKLPDWVQSSVIGFIAFAAAIGPVAFGLGEVFKVGSALAGLGKILVSGQLLSSVTSLGGILAGGAFTTGAVAIGGVTLALAGLGVAIYEVNKNWDNFKSSFKSASDLTQPLDALVKSGEATRKVTIAEAQQAAALLAQTRHDFGTDLSVKGLSGAGFTLSGLKPSGAAKPGGGHPPPIFPPPHAIKGVDDFAKALANLNSIGDSLQDTIDSIDGSVLEGVKYYLQRGAAVSDLAKVYGLTSEQVQAVSTGMKQEDKALDDTIAGMDGFRQSTIEAAKAIANQFHPQLKAILQTQVVAEKRMALESKSIGEGFVGLAPDLSGQAKEHMKGATGGGGLFAGLGDVIGGGNISDLLTRAFTGGGGLGGFGQGLGAQVAGVFGKGLGSKISGMFGGVGAKGAMSLVGSLVSGLATFGLSMAVEGVVALIKHLHKSEAEKAAADVGRDFGVTISENLSKAIEATMKSSGLKRAQASILHLKDIIGEAGGLNAGNFDKFLGGFRDVFSFLERGEMTVSQVTKVLDENFATFAEHGTDKLGLLDKRLVEFIGLNERMGTSSKAISDYVVGQLGSVIGGLDTFLKNATVSTQESATAIGAAIGGTFGMLLQQGQPILTVLEQMKPILEQFAIQLQTTGFDGGTAFATIQQLAAIASDQIAGPALTAVDGLRQVLVGLSNTGLLDQQTFAGLTGQITSTFQSLIAQGFSGNQVLALMQPTLQTIWTLQQQFGFAVDATTQSLIDQGIAAGLVGEQFKTPQQQMIDGLTHVADILTAIAVKLGAELPAAAATGAAAIGAAFNKIPDVDVNVNAHLISSGQGLGNEQLIPFTDPGYTSAPNPFTESAATGGLVTASGIQHFAAGGRVLPFIPRGTDTVPAMLTPGEVVLNKDQQSALGPKHIHIHVGTKEIAEVVLDDIASGGGNFGKFRKIVRQASA